MFRTLILSLTSSLALLASPGRAQAYDMDCAIMLCMAGGFPPSAVCARAYRVMIRRIMPWPSQPPFGICSFAAVPVSLGGSGEKAELNTSLPEHDWLNQTHVIWFRGWSHKSDGEPRQWDWSIRSCDRENRTCRFIERVYGSDVPWSGTFISESGQIIAMPAAQSFGGFFAREIMVEFGDYEGNMGHSAWFSY